jgi:CDP-diacylglycerol--glycerol-3-phosphate 3-phosphatidyltransferase
MGDSRLRGERQFPHTSGAILALEIVSGSFKMMFTVPNLLSIIRLGLALSLPLIAWYGKTGLFFMALVTALLTDAVDGWIARRFSQASPLGTKLDSWSDLTLSFTVPLSVWWLFPKVIYREIVFVGILIGSYITPTIMP